MIDAKRGTRRACRQAGNAERGAQNIKLKFKHKRRSLNRLLLSNLR
jgi:hypothetical protein